MASKQREGIEAFPAEEPGFDVTIETVVGRVMLNGIGRRRLEAAFQIIATVIVDGIESTYRG
jgi:hypothetical protein